MTAHERGRFVRLARVFRRRAQCRLLCSGLEKIEELVVPTISIYEVFKRILQQRDEAAALQAVALMHQGDVVNLTAPLALNAARISRTLALPMADSIMLATATSRDAVLWTQDADFAPIPGVKYVAKAT